MKLNQATDYAFRAVLYLSCRPYGEVVNVQTMAEKQNIPTRFLLKIMRSLRLGGIVNSQRGVDGGFSLAKMAENITLLDVIEAMEGNLKIHCCLDEQYLCNNFGIDECPVHIALDDIQNKLKSSLTAINFADLAEKLNKANIGLKEEGI